MGANLTEIVERSSEYTNFMKEFKERAEAMQLEVKMGNRYPFQQALVAFLSVFPSEAAIRMLAEKLPDRWVQAIMMMAKLAGYREEVQMSGGIVHVVAKMSS